MRTFVGKEVLRQLAKKYYGLYLPVEKGMSSSEQYKQYVLKGKPAQTEELPGFISSEEDSILSFLTPEGAVEVISLKNRMDFELFLQKLAYRCEPVSIQKEIGAMMIAGVINWEKINRHKREYLEKGGIDWNQEFRRFTSDADNFKDRVLILSNGPYSNYPASKAGYSEEDWNRLSADIRMYHECTHYICRKRWPQRKHKVVDEVVADAVGIFAAFGYYRTELALGVLGVSEKGTYTGGRLSFYVEEEKLNEVCAVVIKCVNQIYDICKNNQYEPFVLLERIMEENSLWENIEN